MQPLVSRPYLALIPFALALSSPGVALAGQVKINADGEELHWMVPDVPFYLNPEGKHGLSEDDVEQAVIDSAEEWNGVEGSWLQLQYEGRNKVALATNGDGIQGIYFDDNWQSEEQLLALTYVWSLSTGEITHFDIAINSADHGWTVTGEEGKNDLHNALTHEFGHAVGLDHSDDKSATMAANTYPGDVSKRDLAIDDIETYVYLYGGEVPETDTGLGCATTGGLGYVPTSGEGGGAYPTFEGDRMGCATLSGRSPLVGLAAALILALRRRRPTARIDRVDTRGGVLCGLRPRNSADSGSHRG